MQVQVFRKEEMDCQHSPTSALDEHVRHCARDAAGESSERADAMIEEATRAIERLVRA